MLQIAPEQKPRRLVAVCSASLHDRFMAIADRTGESAGSILRSLAAEAVDRAARGEPVTRGLTAGAPTTTGG